MKNKIKLGYSLGAILSLIILMTASLPAPALAAAGDETVTSPLTLTATFECISVYASFTNDNNADNQATLEYRESGGTWKQGMDLTVDRRDSVQGVSTWAKQWRGSILGCTPGTLYEVRVTFSDADGITGTNPVTGTITTRNDVFPLGSGSTYYVATTGNDTTGDGSLGNPWKTIQKGLDTVAAGDTVYVRGGTYHETLAMKTSGAAGNYITILAYTGETPVVDFDEGADLHSTYHSGDGWWTGIAWQAKSYIRLSGFTLTGAENCIISMEGFSHHNVIEYCHIEDYGIGVPNAGISMTGYWTAGNYPADNLVQYCTITSGRNTYPDHLHRENGIALWYTRGEGNVIRYNTIYGTDNGTPTDDPTLCGMGDGIGGVGNYGIYDGPFKDCDIYGNTIGPTGDESIESEGGNINVRIWGNVCHNSWSGIAGASVTVGPRYVFRNTIWANSSGFGIAFKSGVSSTGYQYFYHNTVYCAQLGTAYGVGWGEVSAPLQNIVSKNNILIMRHDIFEFRDGQTYNSTYVFDYNDLVTTYTRFCQWDESPLTNYTTWAAFRTGTGQEAHGISADPKFVNSATGDFTLMADSPCIDAGITVTGFNDADSPWPTRGGAPDMGAFEYDSGAYVQQPPVLDPIGDKLVSPGWPLQFTVSATDPNNDPLTYSASNLPPWATFDPATRTFSGTANQTAIYSNVQFTVSDGAATDSENITISVVTNNAPVINPIGNQSGNEGQLLTFTVSATDPESDPLTYSASNLPPGATFNAVTRSFVWTPAYSHAGVYPNVCFSVTDSELSVSQNVTVTVNNVNRAPVLSPIGNKTVTEGQTLTFTVSATDPDGDSLTYSSNNIPAGSSYNTTSRVFSFTPAVTGQSASYANVNFAASDGALTASEAITISVEATPSNPPSGDSGGGGGGGGAVSISSSTGVSRITSIWNSMTASGMMTEEVSALDVNLHIELVIPKGTIVRNRMGQITPSIKITEYLVSQPANSGSEMVSPSFEIYPDGTTFQESAKLIFRYKDPVIPQGVSENSLYIALWDPDAQTWIDLGGTVNPEANTVSVPIQHLSTYALMVHSRPAELTITQFVLSKGEVAPGETIEASIEVNNQGDLGGIYEAVLMLDSAEVSNQSVTLNGGGSQTIVFNVTTEVVGEHILRLGDMTATFVVKKPLSPAAFTISDLNINPLVAEFGKNIEVSATVQNTSDLAGSYQVKLTIDDTATDTREISIDGGGSVKVSFTFVPGTAGQHKADIGGLWGPFEVNSPAPLLPPSADVKLPKLEINSYSAIPNYDNATNTLLYIRIGYQMNQSWESFPDARLMLTVFNDGQFLEQVPLFELGEVQADGQTGIFSYVPPRGWEMGEYTFRAELYDGESLIQDTPLKKLTVTPGSTATMVSWKILGIIIGGALAAGALVLILVLYFRRDMLRDYWK